MENLIVAKHAVFAENFKMLIVAELDLADILNVKADQIFNPAGTDQCGDEQEYCEH